MRIKHFLALVTFFALFLSPSFSYASYGIALHGQPKYKANFTHFDYVNPDAPKGGTLHLQAIGTFDNINPHILKGVSAAGSSLLFQTLMTASMDEPFTQYGLIAKDVQVAKDKSWVEYTINEKARFHDDTHITPEDVIFSFETLRDKGHPFYRTYYKDVEKAQKTSRGKVRFLFKIKGNTELPLIMGQMPVLAKHVWKDKNFSATTLTPFISSGPYKIEKIDQGRSITYRHVKDWWAKDLPTMKGQYNFDKIHYDYYRDANVALEAFFAGKYDIRIENSAKNWATAYSVPPVKDGRIKKKIFDNKLPAGMQGFIFNTRRPIFSDPRVRQAITLAFDFEWGNKNVAYSAYKRTNSYFENSELAARGLPSKDELKLLEPLKKDLPPEVFTKAYEAPKTDGSGHLRNNLRKAMHLLKEAGWEIKDKKLKNQKGEIFSFEILGSSDLFGRWVQPFIRNLKRLGIDVHFRIADTAQYQNRLNDFDFDMIVHVFGQSVSPGNEQRNYWSSSKADIKGSYNFIGIKNKAVDVLVDKIVEAKTRKDLITACRALDRALLWGHYVIPHWYFSGYRIAYWDKFSYPEMTPPYGFSHIALWWFDQNKAALTRSPK